jgi:hypothetical protein
MTQTQYRLAGNISVGDKILWDGVPAVVTAHQNYRTAMLPGIQTEIMATGTLDGDEFVAAWAGACTDRIFLADNEGTKS